MAIRMQIQRSSCSCDEVPAPMGVDGDEGMPTSNDIDGPSRGAPSGVDSSVDGTRGGVRIRGLPTGAVHMAFCEVGIQESRGRFPSQTRNT
eukprot:4779966-Prymnesium_polylepis.1